MNGLEWLLKMMYEHAVGDHNVEVIKAYFNQALGAVVALQYSHDTDNGKWRYFGKMYEEIRKEWQRIRGEA